MIHATPYATGLAAASVLYRNVLGEGLLDFSSETPDGFAANALGPQTFDFWTPAAVPATLGVTLADPVWCDACAVVAHTLGSAGATLEVQHREDGDWVTDQTVTPGDDGDLLLIFGGVEASQWRIRISGGIAHVGVVMIGPRLLIPDGVVPDYVPINLALEIDLTPNVSRGGQYLGTKVERVGAGTSIQLAPQERWWIETEARAFIAHYNAGRPFIWSSLPELLPDDIAYCWRSGGTLRASYGPGAEHGTIGMEVQAYVGS